MAANFLIISVIPVSALVILSVILYRKLARLKSTISGNGSSTLPENNDELLKSKRRYQTLTETSPVGIFHTDASGLTTYVNPHWCKISGMPSDEALGNGWLNALHPEDRKIVSIGWEKATLAHQSSLSEYRFVKPDGSIAWILGQAIPERNERDEIVGYVGTATDITERKIAQEKIERILKEKETVLNRISDSMVSVDNEWRYTFLNDASLATHPLGREQTLGKNMWDVHPDMKGTVLWDKYHDAMRTRKAVELENYFSPLQIWFSVKVYPSDDGLTIFYRDITEEKKAAEEIINKEKRFRALIENSTDGLSVLATDGSVLDISPSGKKILGYNEQDVIGKIRPDLIHPDDLEMVSAIFNEVIDEARFAKTIEYRHKMPDGSYRWLESSFKNLLHEPYLNGIVLNYHDITEKKNAALQLKRSEEKYRKAQTIGKMGHWELDLKTNLLTWSDEIYRIFDVGKNEYQTLHDAFLKLMHPDDMETFEQVEKEVLLGRSKLDFIHRIISKKGDIKYVHEVGEITCNDSGEAVLFTGTVQDISEQVIAQNEIIKERNLSDSIINTMPGVFYLYNQQGKLLRWNSNLEKVTLYSHVEIAQMHPLDFFDTDEKEIVGNKIMNVFEVGEDTLQANFFLKTKKKIPYYFTGKSIIYQGVPCLVGVGIDFSDRVKAQEKIRETTEQLRELAAHLQNIREEERIDIARDIHDDLGQQLTAVKIGMFRLLKEVSGDVEKEKNVNTLIDMTGTCIESIRRISTQLRPGILDDLGLTEAMKWQLEEFEKRFAIPVHAQLPEDPPLLKPKITIGLFRMFQETLTNIARHANASAVNITFEAKGHEIILIINDNGNGFDMEQIKSKRSLGLLGMQERAYMIGGDFQINSKPGQGTEIKIIVPVNH